MSIALASNACILLSCYIPAGPVPCMLPKDVNAFAKMTEGTPLGTLLAPLHELNAHFRGAD